MVEIINKEEFIRKRIDLIVSTCILSVAMFFIMGNYRMIKLSKIDISVLNGVEVLQRNFSLSQFEILGIYILCAMGIGFLFKDKDEFFESIVIKKSKKHTVFITKVLICFLPIISSLIINSIVKLIIYFILKENVFIPLEIGQSAFGLYMLYVFIITFSIFSILFLLNICVKSRWIAALIPAFVINSIILVLGIGLLFISDLLEKVKGILEPIEAWVLKLLNIIYSNKSLPVDDVDKLKKILIMLFIVSLITLSCSYGALYLLNKKNIRRFYTIGVIRHIFYIALSLIIGFYSVTIIDYVKLLGNNEFDFQEGLFQMNGKAFIAIAIIYIVLNLVYKLSMIPYLRYTSVNNEELVKSNEDYEIKDEEIFEDVESKESDIIIINDESRESSVIQEFLSEDIINDECETESIYEGFDNNSINEITIVNKNIIKEINEELECDNCEENNFNCTSNTLIINKSDDVIETRVYVEEENEVSEEIDTTVDSSEKNEVIQISD